MGSKPDDLKTQSNTLAMTEAAIITGNLCLLMPNGPLSVRLTGQLQSQSEHFTIILAFVMQHSNNMPLFTDLLIIQPEQNADIF